LHRVEFWDAFPGSFSFFFVFFRFLPLPVSPRAVFFSWSLSRRHQDPPFCWPKIFKALRYIELLMTFMRFSPPFCRLSPVPVPPSPPLTLRFAGGFGVRPFRSSVPVLDGVSLQPRGPSLRWRDSDLRGSLREGFCWIFIGALFFLGMWKFCLSRGVGIPHRKGRAFQGLG